MSQENVELIRDALNTFFQVVDEGLASRLSSAMHKAIRASIESSGWLARAGVPTFHSHPSRSTASRS
jgi:hypothetical protein